MRAKVNIFLEIFFGKSKIFLQKGYNFPKIRLPCPKHALKTLIMLKSRRSESNRTSFFGILRGQPRGLRIVITAQDDALTTTTPKLIPSVILTDRGF